MNKAIPVALAAAICKTAEPPRPYRRGNRKRCAAGNGIGNQETGNGGQKTEKLLALRAASQESGLFRRFAPRF